MAIAGAGGKPVDVGGHTLRAQLLGTEGPTVVFENGGGSPSYTWSLVEEQLAGVTSTVTYDRAGIGWSEPRRGPATPSVVSAELETLLLALGAPTPWILVAHSIGGLYAIDFCARNRERVAGLVMVDASGPEVYAPIRASFSRPVRLAQRFMPPLMTTADHLGLLTRLQGPGAKKLPAGVMTPPGWDRAAEEFWQGRNRLLGNAAEIRDLTRSCDEVRGVTLGELPMVVVSAGKPDPMFAKFWDTWESGQRDLLGLSSNARQVVAGKSGHYVQLSEPELVTEAVISLLAAKPVGNT